MQSCWWKERLLEHSFPCTRPLSESWNCSMSWTPATHQNWRTFSGLLMLHYSGLMCQTKKGHLSKKLNNSGVKCEPVLRTLYTKLVFYANKLLKLNPFLQLFVVLNSICLFQCLEKKTLPCSIVILNLITKIQVII